MLKAADFVTFKSFLFIIAVTKAKDKYGRTILMKAADYGSAKIVRTLLGYGADINETNRKGKTPLMYAAKKGHTDTVKILLANNAYVNAKNLRGWTALMYAASSGNRGIVETLIDAGADVDSADNLKHMASMIAREHGYRENSGLKFSICGSRRQQHRWLSFAINECGCQGKIYSGEMALTDAILQGHTNTIKLLLDT